ncbi:MAG: hypothetical protein PHN52_05945 [candidate division Zixibacteria bacterium]|nr:hypothetical protein [candidate division Zixibacteria bacterium]
MKKLESRHYVFLGLFVVILLTMLLNVRLEIRVSPETQKMYNYIDSLPEGSVLMVSFDHEASAVPEIKPLALSILRHAFKKGHKLIGVSLLAEGTGIGYRLMQETAGEYNKVYGRDLVYLGFKPQYIAAILSMGESIPETFPEDYLGRPYTQFPLLDSVKNYDNVAGVISIADGSLTTHWIEYAHARYHVPVTAAVAAVMMTTYDPYISSGQLHAMVGGLRGAAEYEKLLKIGGSGRRGMLAQTSAHLYVIAMIIAGNIVYFLRRNKRVKS